MVLRGFVAQGNGWAREWMKDDTLLSQILGVGLHPGSMNIYVKGRHCLFDKAAHPGQICSEGRCLFDQDIHPGHVCAAGHLWALPCRVGAPRLGGFILRAEHPGPRDPIPRPHTMFEVVSRFGLRTALGLHDGDPVDLDFDPSQVKRYPVA
jgi:CTP-dependent riboflavin kinase